MQSGGEVTPPLLATAACSCVADSSSSYDGRPRDEKKESAGRHGGVARQLEHRLLGALPNLEDGGV